MPTTTHPCFLKRRTSASRGHYVWDHVGVLFNLDQASTDEMTSLAEKFPTRYSSPTTPGLGSITYLVVGSGQGKHPKYWLAGVPVFCQFGSMSVWCPNPRPCRIPVGVPVALRSKSRSCLGRRPGRSVFVSTSLSYSGRCIGRVSVSVPVSRFALSGRASVSGRVLVSVPVTFRLVSRSAVSGRVVSRSCRDPFSTVFWLMYRSCFGLCPGGVLVVLVISRSVYRPVCRSCLGRCYFRFVVGVLVLSPGLHLPQEAELWGECRRARLRSTVHI